MQRKLIRPGIHPLFPKNVSEQNINPKQISLNNEKILFTLFALVLASGIAAQIPEPDFIGEVLAIHSDGTAEKLEKHNVKMRTGAGVYIAGLAVNKSKTKILVAGSQANVRFAADEPVNLIVRAVDNKTDPMSIVRVFAMKNNRKQRSAVISAVGSFNVTSNDMEYLPFTAEKYGENSYYLTFGDAPAGEYGIIVTNPNNVDEKMIIVSAFGIDPEKCLLHPVPKRQRTQSKTSGKYGPGNDISISHSTTAYNKRTPAASIGLAAGILPLNGDYLR